MRTTRKTTNHQLGRKPPQANVELVVLALRWWPARGLSSAKSFESVDGQRGPKVVLDNVGLDKVGLDNVGLATLVWPTMPAHTLRMGCSTEGLLHAPPGTPNQHSRLGDVYQPVC